MYRVATLQFYMNRALALLSVGVAACVFLYGALLLMAVDRAAAQTAAQREIRDLTTAIRPLETRYFEETKTVTPERAAELGFVAPAASTAVFATAASRAVTLQGFGERSRQ